MTTYFPLFFNMEGREIRVFGGGNIAARRVKTLLEFGAKVSVVAPQITEELEKLAGQQEKLSLEYRRYRCGELTGEWLVLAATDDHNVNDTVFQECRQKQILVNVSSDKEKCDFYFPGIAKAGDITVGVTAGGSNHHKAAQITKKIRGQLSEWEEERERS